MSCAAAVLGAALSLVGAAAQAAPVACRPDLAILAAADGHVLAQFSVTIADDDAERSRGLMQVRAMPLSQGMLFAYDSPRPVIFWMHDTLIALDMVFLDGAGRVVSVHDHAQPMDDTPIPSGAPAQFVLEVNAGLARRLGIVPGTVLLNPLVPAAQAALPCG